MEDILFPDKGVFRTIFLYVGQGESTLMIIPDGDNHKYVLIDSNKDDEKEGINISEFLKGNISENELIFINTHPHKDHLKDIDKIHEQVSIGEIWHSGHIPHKDNKEEYDKMQEIIKEIGSEQEYYLKGSNDLNIMHSDIEDTSKVNKKIGDVDFHVFSPAQYITDEIADEDENTRRNRIHEQCAVIKFTYKEKSILITGDSDKNAWKNNITDYFKDSLKSDILSASHHGSRSFFKNSEDDKDIYEEHIENIAPEYLIISAPKDSPHDHPHDDAMKIYKKHIEEDNIFNLGDDNKSVLVDINSEGNLSIEKLKISVENDSNGKKEEEKSYFPYIPSIQSNNRPYLSYVNK